jgi:phage baseplate assembly protein W
MKKNVASQVIGAQMVSATDGSAFTGSVTAYVTGDGGTQAVGSVGSGVCTHEGNGFHTYTPAQAETNYDHVGFTFIGTGAVPATVQVYPSFPQTGDGFARLGAPAGASVSADIAAIEAQTDDIGAAGAGLTALPWNAAWDAQVESEVADALAAYDAATGADVTSATSGLATAANLATVAGYLDTEIAAILADTDELQQDWANGGRLDLILDARASQASVDAIDTVVDAIKAVTDALPDSGALSSLATAAALATVDGIVDSILVDTAEIGAAGAGLTALPWNSTWDAQVESEVADALVAYDAATGTDVTSATSGLATAANLATVASYLDTEIAAILADTDELQQDWANGGRLDLILDARASQTTVDDILTDTGTTLPATLATIDGIVDDILVDTAAMPTAADIADAVWDETLSGHAGVGSTGAALAAAGGSGDPWATALPGAYGAGTAGQIVGDYIDAAISSISAGSGLDAAGVRAAIGLASANLDTQLGAIDTDVGGIKAVTDALPDAGALTSLATAAALATVDGNVDSILVDTAEIGAAGAGLTALASASNLAVVAGYLDTEIAAIKAVTDAIPDGGAMTSIATAAALATVDGIVDAILVDTAEIGAAGAGLTALASAADLATVDGNVDAIKAKTDSLTFTVANQVRADVRYVNGTQVTGNGSPGTEWGPV